MKRTTSIAEVERHVDGIRLRPPFGYMGVRTTVQQLFEQGARATVSGQISLHQWDMNLGVNTQWIPEQDTYLKDFLQKKAQQRASTQEKGVLVVAGDAARHEFGHPKYCPISMDSYVVIKNVVAEELQRMGIQSTDAVDYLTNAFMDLIDNTGVRKDRNGEGLTIFYYTQGDSKFFSSFIWLNMLCWGDETDRELIMKKFDANLDPATRKEAEQMAMECARQFGLLQSAFNSNERPFNEKAEILLNAAKWEQMVRTFIRIYARTVQFKQDPANDPNKPSQDPNQGKSGEQNGKGQDKGKQDGPQGKDKQKGEKGKQEGQQGEGEGEEDGQQGQKGKDGKQPGQGQGEEDDQDGDGQGQGKGQKKGEKGKQPGQGTGQGESEEEGEEGEGGDSPGKHMGKKTSPTGTPTTGRDKGDKVDEPDTSQGQNPFDQHSNSEEGKKQAIHSSIKSGRGLPKYMDPDEAIDMYFEMTSRAIPLKAKANQRGQMFPVAPYGRKAFDPERDDPEMISGVMITDDGRPGLEAWTDEFEVNAPLVDRMVKHPNVCWIIDSSGSMQGSEGVPLKSSNGKEFGSDCPYGKALKSVHGTRNELRARNVLPYIQTNTIIYSDATISTGWQPYAGSNAGRASMARPLFGGTVLDPEVLETQLGGQNEPSVVIIVSDGAINNWERDKARIMPILSRHLVAFIEIGPETQTGKDLKAMGAQLIRVTSNQDLEKVMIDVTDQMINRSVAAQRLGGDWHTT